MILFLGDSITGTVFVFVKWNAHDSALKGSFKWPNSNVALAVTELFLLHFFSDLKLLPFMLVISSLLTRHFRFHKEVNQYVKKQ